MSSGIADSFVNTNDLKEAIFFECYDEQTFTCSARLQSQKMTKKDCDVWSVVSIASGWRLRNATFGKGGNNEDLPCFEVSNSKKTHS